jgi:hypothetical protein
MNFSILRSKTFWFTVVGAAAHVAFTPPAQRGEAIMEGLSAVGAMWGLRGAVAKNGEGK